jgi:hypothetical protein
MDLSIHNRALMGLLAGAVVFAASACSRSDRSDTGRDNTGAVSPDSASTQPTNSAVTPPSGDSASITSSDTGISSGTEAAAARGTTPRSKTSTPHRSIRDTSAAGYRSMERDTTTAPTAPRDTARATTDSVMPGGQSSVTPSDSAPMEVATPTTADTSVSNPDVAVQDTASGEATATIPADSSSEMAATTASTDTAAAQDMSADTAAAGYAEMARDTSAAPAQADSGVAMQARVDTARTDSTAIENGEVAVASADTATETERIRPPEDSTETLGAVTTNETASADSTDEVGAAAIGSGNVNAADAVALMTRQGAQCIVVGPETAEGVAVDMSNTPATLNPCGLGSMVLSRIWTKKE